MTEKKLTGT